MEDAVRIFEMFIVINLPNTIEIHRLLNICKPRKSFEILSDRIVDLSRVTGEILSSLLLIFVAYIQKFFPLQISKCYTIVILHKTSNKKEITYETIVVGNQAYRLLTLSRFFNAFGSFDFQPGIYRLCIDLVTSILCRCYGEYCHDYSDSL